MPLPAAHRTGGILRALCRLADQSLQALVFLLIHLGQQVVDVIILQQHKVAVAGVGMLLQAAHKAVILIAGCAV